MALDPTGTGREAGVAEPRGRAAGVGQGAGWRWRGAEAAPPSRVPGSRPAGPRQEGSGMAVRLWLADVSPPSACLLVIMLFAQFGAQAPLNICGPT